MGKLFGAALVATGLSAASAHGGSFTFDSTRGIFSHTYNALSGSSDIAAPYFDKYTQGSITFKLKQVGTDLFDQIAFDHATATPGVTMYTPLVAILTSNFAFTLTGASVSPAIGASSAATTVMVDGYNGDVNSAFNFGDTLAASGSSYIAGHTTGHYELQLEFLSSYESVNLASLTFADSLSVDGPGATAVPVPMTAMSGSALLAVAALGRRRR